MIMFVYKNIENNFVLLNYIITGQNIYYFQCLFPIILISFSCLLHNISMKVALCSLHYYIHKSMSDKKLLSK